MSIALPPHATERLFTSIAKNLNANWKEHEQDKDKEEGMTTAIGVSTATGKEPTKVSYNGHAAANRPVKPPSVGHAPRQRAD